jgi:hypothetical protein
MKKLKHIIYTQFNWGWLDSNRKDVSGIPVNTFEWLDRRVQLFEAYCLPSIENQSNKNFIWHIVFDERTPEEYYEKYEGRANIIITLSDGLNNLVNTALSEDPCEYILTSRVDNDDALSTNYVDTVQKVAKRHMEEGEEKIFINFPNGFYISPATDSSMHDNSSKIMARELFYNSNPFSSLLEKVVSNPKDLDTILAYYSAQLKGWSGHESYQHFWKTHNKITDDFMWMHTLHNTNLINSQNQFRGFSRAFLPDYKNSPGFKHLFDY